MKRIDTSARKWFVAVVSLLTFSACEHSITRKEARSIAEGYIADKKGWEIREVREAQDGWVFEFGPGQNADSRNPNDQVPGNWPLWVHADGKTETVTPKTEVSY